MWCHKCSGGKTWFPAITKCDSLEHMGLLPLGAATSHICTAEDTHCPPPCLGDGWEAGVDRGDGDKDKLGLERDRLDSSSSHQIPIHDIAGAGPRIAARPAGVTWRKGTNIPLLWGGLRAKTPLWDAMHCHTRSKLSFFFTVDPVSKFPLLRKQRSPSVLRHLLKMHVP